MEELAKPGLVLVGEAERTDGHGRVQESRVAQRRDFVQHRLQAHPPVSGGHDIEMVHCQHLRSAVVAIVETGVAGLAGEPVAFGFRAVLAGLRHDEAFGRYLGEPRLAGGEARMVDRLDLEPGDAQRGRWEPASRSLGEDGDPLQNEPIGAQQRGFLVGEPALLDLRQHLALEALQTVGRRAGCPDQEAGCGQERAEQESNHRGGPRS